MLVFCFSFFTLFPWVHVLTARGHEGHACCEQAEGSASPCADGAAGFAQQSEEPSEACWICQGLMALLQPAEAEHAPSSISIPPQTQSVARAPQAPVWNHIYAASRSQAPPARI